MQARQAKIVFSLLAIVVSLGILLFRYFQPVPKIESRPHLALGEALAERAAKLLGSGGRITLIAPDTVAFKYPGAELQLKAFHQALRRAGLSVAVTNLIRLAPLRPPRVPPGDEFVRKLSDADVVVSLMGPPNLTADQKARLGEKRPKVIAVCSGDMPRQINLKAPFADNLLQAVIISRAKPGPPPASENLAPWFDYYFQWITPQNVSDLPGMETAER